MSQVPPDYVPGNDFSTIAAQPVLTTGIPGAELDAEFAAIAETANDTIDRLSEIQRDDGQIRNGMVKVHTLAADVLALLTAAGVSIRGAWQSGQSYEVGDLVTQQFNSSMVIGGTLTPDATGTLLPAGYFLGQPTWSSNGQQVEDSGVYPWVQIYGDGTHWFILHKAGSLSISWSSWTADQTTQNPADASGWGPTLVAGGVGTPTVTAQALENFGTYIAIAAHLSGTNFDDDIRNWALIASPPSAGNLVIDTLTGDGVEVDFVLSTQPLSEANTQVYIDGVYQPKTTYSLTGSTLTFSAAPPNSAAIEVVSGVTVEVQTAVVADNSVGSDQLLDDAVTTSKIEDGAVTADKLAAGAAVPDNSVSAAKLQSNAVTTDKIAAGNVTEGKLASGAVTEDKLGTGAVSATKLGASSVTTPKIADTAVTAAKLATDAVETLKIKDLNVTTAKLADLGVTGAKVADATLTAAKLVANTLDTLIDARPGVAKVACRFTLSASPALVGSDLNVASVANTGTGTFRVTFTTALASANYIPQVDIMGSTTGRTASIEAFSDATTTYVDVSVRNSAGSANNGVNTEAVTVIILAP